MREGEIENVGSCGMAEGRGTRRCRQSVRGGQPNTTEEWGEADKTYENSPVRTANHPSRSTCQNGPKSKRKERRKENKGSAHQTISLQILTLARNYRWPNRKWHLHIFLLITQNLDFFYLIRIEIWIWVSVQISLPQNVPKLLKKIRAVGSPEDCPSPCHHLQKAAVGKSESRVSLLPFILPSSRWWLFSKR